MNICGVSFNYTVEGEGKPVVLMHGWGCNHTTLASIEQFLTPSFKVYNVDFPGFGKSTEPEKVWGMEEYTRLMEEFFKAEKIDNPILLGHSFGGRVGILLASRNKTHKLILVDAAGIKPRRTLAYYCKVYSYKAVRHTLPERLQPSIRKNAANHEPRGQRRFALRHAFDKMPHPARMGNGRHGNPHRRRQKDGRTYPGCRVGGVSGCRALQFLGKPISIPGCNQQFFRERQTNRIEYA